MGQSMRPLSCAKTVYTFQERAENFSGRGAPRFGRAAAQRNETGRVLKQHASAKRHRRDSQRAGAWARLEADKISRFKQGRAIALFHGRSLQRETIPKSARIPDETTGSQPGVGGSGQLIFLAMTSLRVKTSLY